MKVDSAPPVLTCFRIHPIPSMPIVPATVGRAWIDATAEHFANRCLPLLIANQHGWFILNTMRFRAVWTGRAEPAAISIQRLSSVEGVAFPVSSHFGHGILTFGLNYVFRTPAGYNLWVRGPSNAPKDGISPLEGIVETDWSVATFTMNWKFTRANRVVQFSPGEPICMIVPVRRGEIEAFSPEICDISEDPSLHESYTKWAESRAEFLSQLRVPNSHAVSTKWQKDYVHGVGPEVKAGQHQVKLHVRPLHQRQSKGSD